ncbi:Nn.00g107360.m01.CDS01 [Neocucurbitaria sp. VM-36]
MAKVREHLKSAEYKISMITEMFDECEDSYRQSGMIYHTCTQLRARQRDVCSENIRVRLTEAFEISSIEEYEAIFAPVNAILQRLTTLRAEVKFVGCQGTVAERFHRLRGIVRALTTLYDDFNKEQKKFIVLEQDAKNVQQISQVFFETDEEGRRIAWQDPEDYGSEYFVPTRMEQEWSIFRDWVGSLPETQRAVTVGGRCLNEVTMELLFSEPEEQQHDVVVEEVGWAFAR